VPHRMMAAAAVVRAAPAVDGAGAGSMVAEIGPGGWRAACLGYVTLLSVITARARHSHGT
jgi:hypothetical protein